MSDRNMQEIRNKRTLMGNNKRVWRMKKQQQQQRNKIKGIRRGGQKEIHEE